MKKKNIYTFSSKVFLLVALLCCVCNGAFAYDFTAVNDDGVTIYYNYINDGKDAEVTYDIYGHSSYSGVVNIPATITADGKTISVTGIGEWAFVDSRITSITIPNTVTSISEVSFCHCSSLTSIEVKDGNAYYHMDNNCLIETASNLLIRCCNLANITIHNYVKKISRAALDGCSNLTSIEVEQGNAYYHTDSNCLIETASNKLIRGCNLTNITIPNSVTSIGWSAFDNCSSLTSITIPNSVTSIGDYAFECCSSLYSVTVPNSVTNIGYAAFADCSSLPSINIPNSVTSVGDYAFDYCSSLAFVTIGNSVASLGEYAFRGCSSLTSVDIPNSVTSINDWTFGECSSLTSVTIPNSVKSIGYAAFYFCTSLTTITIPNSVTSIGEYAFCDCSSLTSVNIPNSVKDISRAMFTDCQKLLSITIPDSVTSIGEWAFQNCSSLTSITIPNSVISISDSVFAECSNLKTVTIGESVKEIGYDAFCKCPAIVKLIARCATPPTCGSNALTDIDKQKCTLYVPKNTLSAYKAADQWKDFLLMEEGDPTGINMPSSNRTNIIKRYDTNGRPTYKPTKGLNIVKMSDGTTKKVMQK